MHRRSIQFRSSSVAMYTLGAIFLVPLSIGVLLVNSNASENDRVKQVSRELASMYAEGMDFSRAANQTIAAHVAESLGLNIGGGQTVVILSKIRMVRDSDCQAQAAQHCANNGYPVVVQRVVIGNPALRSSSFGASAKVDSTTGTVVDWMNDPSARVQGFGASLKPGGFTYAAECYLSSPEPRGGIYSRTTL